MHGFVEVALHCGSRSTRIDDEHTTASAQRDVGAHGGQPSEAFVVQHPIEVKPCIELMFLTVILAKELQRRLMHCP